MLTAATMILCILVVLVMFQLALAMGAPIGRFAWGGQHRVLPTRLRLGSAVSIVLYACFAVLVLSKTGIMPIIGKGAFLDWSLWAITFYLAMGVPLNVLSRSKPERYTMTPVVVVLVICFVVISLV